MEKAVTGKGQGSSRENTEESTRRGRGGSSAGLTEAGSTVSRQGWGRSVVEMTAGRGHVRTRSTPAHPREPWSPHSLGWCPSSTCISRSAWPLPSTWRPQELRCLTERNRPPGTEGAVPVPHPVLSPPWSPGGLLTHSRSPARKCAIGDCSDVLEAERDSRVPLFCLSITDLCSPSTCSQTESRWRYVREDVPVEMRMAVHGHQKQGHVSQACYVRARALACTYTNASTPPRPC